MGNKQSTVLNEVVIQPETYRRDENQDVEITEFTDVYGNRRQAILSNHVYNNTIAFNTISAVHAKNRNVKPVSSPHYIDSHIEDVLHEVCHKNFTERFETSTYSDDQVELHLYKYKQNSNCANPITRDLYFKKLHSHKQYSLERQLKSANKLLQEMQDISK